MRDRKRNQQASSAPWAMLAVVAALLFVAFVRLRVVDVPLERDEGEYAYAGQLILEGVPPYAIAYNMKFPGVYYAYALIMAVLGHTPSGIHAGLLLINAASIVLVFVIGRRLLGEFAGASAAVTFAILSIDRWIFGVFAHATHFVVVMVLAGLYLLLRAMERGRLGTFLWSGVLFGVAVLMKQHAIFFLPLAAALIVWGGEDGAATFSRDNVKKVGLVAFGSLIPVAIVLLVLAAQGVFGRFWFWTFRYAAAYVTEVPVSLAWKFFSTGFPKVVEVNSAFWILAALGIAALWTSGWDRRAKLVVSGLLLASLLSICPGFYFRGHYFILLLPVLALLCGVAVATARRFLEARVSRGAALALAVAILAAPIGYYVATEHDYLFSMTTRDLSRVRFGNNPFIEAVEIAKYIRERTDANDTIAVMGSEPEIYFYADRKAATGYIYTYALVEIQPLAKSMQEEMIREIEAAHPRYLVFSWVDVSWLLQPGADQGIIEWGRSYVRQCYEPVGVVDIYSMDQSYVAWGDDVRAYKPVSPNVVYTFRRKSDAACTVAR
jgi:Dolichyl-phosphate-mannose-protein mannosyltransferase